MEIRFGFVLLISSALSALVAGDCTKFEFNQDDHEHGSTNPYTIERDMFRVSPIVNCTSLPAQNGSDTNNSTCGFHRYSMGLLAYPRLENWTFVEGEGTFVTNLYVDADTRNHIFSLVQETNPPNITSGDFNATIVMNFTTTLDGEPNIPFNVSGFYGFLPLHICWNGTLSGCNGTDGLEGARVQACALKWQDDDQRLLSPGQQQYTDNRVGFRPAGFAPIYEAYTDNPSSDPWPTYDELAPNATVYHNATSNQTGNDDNNDNGNGNDNDESSAWVKDVGFLTLMGLVSCSVISNWL
ncbi:hypothetical protein F5Y09DRAFT_293542 [Xylaria sp. FL1042]|nr:hypothetical protein F5Y09DRAFT_293186 [Xylaria sp. FL1042]KAI0435421.1 hypothetical protein F5Y09DRAFT_293542 [Xylaria sp. FL1042]